MIMKVFGIYLVLATTHVLGLVDYKCPNVSASTAAHREFCERALVDDLILAPDTYFYTFRGDQVVRGSHGSISSGFPKPAKELWPNIPANIDAAFTFSVTKKTYFLKGSQYWRYTNFTLDEGFPMPISEGFSGVPDNVDAAVEWNEYIYFFKDQMNYRYDPCRNVTFKIPLRDIVGLPNTRLDGVLKHDNSGNVYFIIGDIYFTYSLSQLKVYPPSPYALGYSFYSCHW